MPPERYASIVDVHVILRRDGGILLLRRAGDTYASGQLCLPSGHMEEGESIPPGLRFSLWHVAHRENRGVVRVFPVVLPSGERYWTVLDEQLAVVEVADAFLRHARFGRDQAELTTKAYASAVALFLRWCGRTARDWRAAADTALIRGRHAQQGLAASRPSRRE
jgi:hypothetical protein